MTAYSEEQVRDLARRAYHGGTASFAIERARSALVVVDMQDEFVRPGWTPFWVPGATKLVPRLQKAIDRCRALGVPVVWTVFSRTHHYLDRPAAGAFMPNRYPEIGSPDPAWFRDGRIWNELVPRADEVLIHKPSYGAFWDTPLERILSNLRRDTIIVAGTLTNFCCGATARQGYERGFKVVVASDLTATDDPDLQEAELQVLRKGYALVLTADEIEATLASPSPSASSAGTPR